MKFSINYRKKDYVPVIKLMMLDAIAQEKPEFTTWLLTKSVALLCNLIYLFHRFGKLRHTFHFEIDPSRLRRRHADYDFKLPWDKFVSYKKYPSSFELSLKEGSLLIPTRVFTPEMEKEFS